MAWALGIEIQRGKLACEFLLSDGNTECRSLEDLASCGTPPSRKISRKSDIVTSFENWTKVNSSEYLKAFGINLPEAVTSRHSIYEFKAKRTRFLIPALALMRALFRPNKYLLPAMFQAQAIDKVCFLEHTSPPKLHVDAFWAQPVYRCMNTCIYDALSWMCRSPSAFRMASSVHEAALQGKIGLTLPTGEARLSVIGIKKGDTFFVNDIVLSSITTNERAFTGEQEASALIAFQANLNSTVCDHARDTPIPALPDGTVELTDSEWNAVRPALLMGARTDLMTLNQRDIFDGILIKMNYGMSWRDVPYKTGGWNHATRAYRCWLRRGTFNKAIVLLGEMRNRA